MTNFALNVRGTADMRAIAREADQLAAGVGSRLSRLQRQLAAGQGPVPATRVAQVQAFGESQIRGAARAGDISVTQFKAELREFRAVMARARAQLARELGRIVPEPTVARVRTERRANDARRAAALGQIRGPAGRFVRDAVVSDAPAHPPRRVAPRRPPAEPDPTPPTKPGVLPKIPPLPRGEAARRKEFDDMERALARDIAKARLRGTDTTSQEAAAQRIYEQEQQRRAALSASSGASAAAPAEVKDAERDRRAAEAARRQAQADAENARRLRLRRAEESARARSQGTVESGAPAPSAADRREAALVAESLRRERQFGEAQRAREATQRGEERRARKVAEDRALQAAYRQRYPVAPVAAVPVPVAAPKPAVAPPLAAPAPARPARPDVATAAATAAEKALAEALRRKTAALELQRKAVEAATAAERKLAEAATAKAGALGRQTKATSPASEPETARRRAPAPRAGSTEEALALLRVREEARERAAADGIRRSRSIRQADKARENRLLDRVGTDAAARHSATPASRGGAGATGDKDPKGTRVPSKDEVVVLQQLVKNISRLNTLLQRSFDAAGPQRHVGLRVAEASEAGLKYFDEGLATRGQETNSQRAARVANIRARRGAIERAIAAERVLDDRDPGLAAEQGRTRALRRKVRHRVEAAQYDYTDPATEAAALDLRSELARQIAAARAGHPTARHGTASEKAERDALTALTKRTEANRRAANATERTAKAEGDLTASDRRLVAAQAESIAAQARRTVAERRFTQAVNTQAQALLAGKVPGQEHLGLTGAERGTRFQRVQANIAGRQGGGIRLPTEFQNFGQFAVSKAVTTAGFAASGAVLYGAVNGIQTLIGEAERLEVVLNQVEAQFDAIGEGDQFQGFRDDILEIARETGRASDEVAFVAFQMKGAFGETTAAVEATSAAIKIARVTGLELNEIVDSLTASALSFSDRAKGVNVSVEDIGDTALALQERFGVLAKETIKGVADIAPIADQVGLKLAEIATLLAGTQQLSGRSGAAIAEGFNRILPALQGVSIEVLNLYSQVPALTGRLDELAGQVARGESGQVLLGLLRDFDQFSKAQQSAVIELLGGRREAQFLTGLFGNRSKILGTLDEDLEAAGKTTEYFTKAQETLSVKMAQLAETFKQAGEALFRAGLATGLQDLATGVTGVLEVLRKLLTVAAEVDEMFGGLPIRLAQAAAAFKLLSLAAGAAVKSQAGARALGVLGLGGVGGRLGRGGRIARRGPLDDNPLAPGGPLAGAAAGGAVALGARARMLAALGGGPGIAITAGIAGYMALQSKRSDAGEKEKRLVDKFDKLDTLELKRLSEERTDFWDRVGAAIGGNLPEPELARRRLNVRMKRPVLDDFVAARQGDLLKDLDEEQREALAQAVLRANTKLGGSNLKNASRAGRLAAGVKLKDVDLDLSDDALDKLQKQFIAGEPKAIATIEAINQFFLKSNDLAARFRSSISGKAARVEFDDVKELVNTGQAFQGASEIEGQVQSGILSVDEALKSYRGYIESFERVLKHEGYLGDQQLREYRDIKGKEAKLTGETARAFVDNQIKLQEAAGAGTDQTAIAAYTALLRSGKIRDPKQRQDLAGEVDRRQKAILDAAIANEDDAVDRARVTREGIPALEETRIVNLEYQLNELSTTWQNFLKVAFGSVEKGAEFTYQTAVGILRGIPAADNAKKLIQQKRAELLAERRLALRTGESTREIDADLAALAAVPTGVEYETPDAKVRGDAAAQAAADKAAAEEAKRKRRELRKAESDLRLAQAGDNPVAQAEAAVREAEFAARDAAEDGDAAAKVRAAADKIKALRAVEEARVDIIRAQLEFGQAQSERDPLTVARLAIQEADLSLQLAAKSGDTAAKLRAAAAKVRATRQMEEAMADVFTAQKELAQAVAEIAGESVRAAQIGADIVAKRLGDAVAAVKLAGGDPNQNAEVLGLRAELLRANKATKDTDFTKKLDDIDFFLQLEKTTTSQAIAQLEGLLSIADPQQTRDLLLKIKALRDQVGQDFQMNLGEFILPTRYESGRLGITERAGIAYQDNRIITVENHNNNAQDYAESISRFEELVSTAPRQGITPRKY